MSNFRRIFYKAISALATIQFSCGLSDMNNQLPDDYSPGPTGDDYATLVGNPSESGASDAKVGDILSTLCGEPVYYNGEDPTSCLGKNCQDPTLNGSFGLERQCTEFAARFVCKISLGCTQKTSRYGNANEWFSGQFAYTSNILKLIPAERRYKSGITNTIPQPGDIITFAIPASTGHVGIIQSVDRTNGLIYSYEQNIKQAFKVSHKLTIDGSGIVTVTNAIGWMRPTVAIPSCLLQTSTPVSVNYQPFSSFVIGGGASYVAMSDVNRDSKLDLISANQGTNTVSVLIGNGDGTFNLHKDYQTGNKPNHIIAVDVNADGKQDLITSNELDNTISVLIGNGDGSYLLPKTYPVGQIPWYVASGDLNRDGKPDIIVANRKYISNNISVLLNNGDGSFAPQQNYSTGRAPVSIATGDLNNDNKQDVIVTNQDDATIGIFLGNGDGSLQIQKTISVSLNPGHAGLADYNLDGKLDIIVSNAASHTIGLLRGNGDGTFQAQMEMSSNATWIAAVDLDSDKKPDIVFIDISNSIAGFYLGNGDGSFRPVKRFSLGTAPYGIAVGDVNGDSVPDIVAADNGQGHISVLLSK